MAPSAKRWVANKPQVGHLFMPIKDAFEMFVKIFNRERPELVEDTPHLDAIVGVRVASILSSDQQEVGLLKPRQDLLDIYLSYPLD